MAGEPEDGLDDLLQTYGLEAETILAIRGLNLTARVLVHLTPQDVDELCSTVNASLGGRFKIKAAINAAKEKRNQAMLQPSVSGVAVFAAHESELAKKLIEQFPITPISLNDIKQCLKADLNCKVPLFPQAQSMVLEKNAHSENFVLASSMDRVNTISATVSLLILADPLPLVENASENTCQSAWDSIFYKLWGVLCSAAGGTGFITVKRNQADNPGLTSSGKRPDLLLLCYGKIIFSCEEKPPHALSINEAIKQLQKNIEPMDPDIYKGMEFSLGAATAGLTCQFFALRRVRGRVVDCHSLTGILRLTDLTDRVACILTSINILRLAISWASVFQDTPHAPIDLGPLVSYYGPASNIKRTIKFLKRQVQKLICPWDEHERAFFTKMAYVSAAYKAIGWGRPELKNNLYKVNIIKRGANIIPSNLFELQNAVNNILQMLDRLHTSELVHRDIRWENVLFVKRGEWILIDYETVWKADEAGLCGLRVWDDEMAMKYTKASDLKLCGKLLEDHRVEHFLNDDFKEFRHHLLRGSFADAGSAFTTFRTAVWKV